MVVQLRGADRIVGRGTADPFGKSPVCRLAYTHFGHSGTQVEEAAVALEEVVSGPAQAGTKTVFGGVAHATPDPSPAALVHLYQQGHGVRAGLELGRVDVDCGVAEEIGLIEILL